MIPIKVLTAISHQGCFASCSSHPSSVQLWGYWCCMHDVHWAAGSTAPRNCSTGTSGYCHPVAPSSTLVCRYSYLQTTTVCRAATGPCDEVESCTGAAADCPADAVKPNCPPVCPAAGLPTCVNQTSGKIISWLSCSGLAQSSSVIAAHQ